MRMVLQLDIHFQFLRGVEVVIDRLNVLFQARRRDAIDRQDRAAEEAGHVRLPAILHREDERERAWRVAGNRNRRDGRRRRA